MNLVALKMLVGDRAKYLGIIMGLTFASLLITQQLAIFEVAADYPRTEIPTTSMLQQVLQRKWTKIEREC